MAISSIQAGRVICRASGWEATNLQLQKLLYAACLNYIGEDKENPKYLIKENFEAWDYGPVQPKLYVFCKDFGKQPIADVFPYENVEETNSDECEMLERIYNWGRDKSVGYLLAYAHRDGGAWDKTIHEFGRVRPVIPYSYMQDELINERRKDRERKEALANV